MRYAMNDGPWCCPGRARPAGSATSRQWGCGLRFLLSKNERLNTKCE